MFNFQIVVGRVNNPEYKTVDTSSGAFRVGNFSVATEESKKVGDKWESETTWHNVNVFGKSAEFCEKHIVKGDLVLVTGAHSVTKKDDKQYHKIKATEVKKLIWNKKDGNVTVQAEEPQQNDDLPF